MRLVVRSFAGNHGRFGKILLGIFAAIALSAFPLYAQYDQPATPPGTPSQSETQKQAAHKKNGQKQTSLPQQTHAQAGPTNSATPAYQSAPELGGPGADSGAIAIPHITPAENVPAPLPTVLPPNPAGLGHLSLRVNVPVVNVDVGVLLEQNHQFVPNLKEDNFAVYENGVRQRINHFEKIHAPITAVLLLEFAATNYSFLNDMENAAYAFLQQMQPNDEIAVETFDLRTHIVTDFTSNRQRVIDALNTLTMPTWRETNLYDALYSTLDRLTRVAGRKYIILVASGLDSFSKVSYDQLLQKIRATPDVTIFSISTGHYARLMADGFGGMGALEESRFAMADNQMQTFARMTGGEYFAPRFETAMPDIFTAINSQIRNEYELSYTPTDRKLDGTYRHIQVRLVNDEGQPLMIVDQKHHRPLRYEVIYKAGYRAPPPVE